jgi:hypothetical protein
MHSLLLLCILSVEPTVSSFLSEDMIGQLESQLSDTCGDRCLTVFHDLLPLISNITMTGEPAQIKHQFKAFNDFMKKYVSDGHEQSEKIMDELANITVSSFALTAQIPVIPGAVKKHPAPRQPGVPCSTQAECDSLDFKLNRCSYLRKASMTAYVGANTVLSVLANLVTVGCGCMFAGPVNVCSLRGVPYTCVFPFSAYQGIYGLSQSLYTAITRITSFCNTGGALLGL